MRLIVEIPSGPLSGKQIEVAVGQTVHVGRASKANVVLADDFLSGVHFALACDSKGCRVIDLNSRNGTKLNGELIIEAPLKNGDKLFAGRTNFTVRFEVEKTERAVETSPPRRARSASSSRGRVSKKIAAGKTSGKIRKVEPPSPETPTQKKEAQAPEDLPPVAAASPPQKRSEAEVVPRVESVSAAALDSYYAATLDGRLVQLLSNQPQPLFALMDGARDAQVLELIRAQGDECCSLYRSEQDQTVAPYLVRLPVRSKLLREMIKKGWGQEWGVYLTSALPLQDLRQYFRTALMITMPDGMELFSRFYDPRFFRGFLENCTAVEAEPFFGPVTSYFMEDERPEILLEFTRGRAGAEKKGHLLSPLN
jgi:pSer/pThr/pTyr-binding forkhead associated (FHA) protein